jgi:branched-chain amino acid transport system ATP-binding protein
MFELKNIFAGYGSARVLENVSLEIPEGEVVAIVGANGAGKTSLVRVIFALLKPTSGTVHFCGEDITPMASHQRAEKGIGIVPEGRRLFPKLTVEENLMVGGINARARINRLQMIQDVFKMFPVLEQRRTQLAQTLSGGEQQMLAIGRALMAQPRMLVFDEPSLGLAPKVILGVFETIRKLNKEQGLTVLLIEQNVALSLELAGHAYVLENGRFALSGKSQDLLADDHVKKAYLGM